MRPLPATLAYTGFLDAAGAAAAAAGGDAAAGVEQHAQLLLRTCACMAPCMRLYAWLGSTLAAAGAQDAGLTSPAQFQPPDAAGAFANSGAWFRNSSATAASRAPRCLQWLPGLQTRPESVWGLAAGHRGRRGPSQTALWWAGPADTPSAVPPRLKTFYCCAQGFLKW